MERRNNHITELIYYPHTALTCLGGETFTFCDKSMNNMSIMVKRIDNGKTCPNVKAFAAELVVLQALEKERQRQILPGKFYFAPYHLEKSGDCGLDLVYLNPEGLILGGIDVKLGIANIHQQYFSGGIKRVYGIPYVNLYLGGQHSDHNCKEIKKELEKDIKAWIQGGAYPKLASFLAVREAKRTATDLLQTLEFNKKTYYTPEEVAMYADFLKIFLSFETPNHLQKF